MGKRLDELNLANEEITSADPRETAWGQFSTDIDELLATGRYTWAEQTLRGIQETVEQTKHVTAAQRRAFTNIEAAHGRRDGARRRYEGYNWRER
jgi:hypothetical protein